MARMLAIAKDMRKNMRTSWVCGSGARHGIRGVVPPFTCSPP
jgi:hypothetical protein